MKKLLYCIKTIKFYFVYYLFSVRRNKKRDDRIAEIHQEQAARGEPLDDID